MPPSPWQHVGGQASLVLRWQKLEGLLGQVGGAEPLFMHLHGQQGAQDTFWLDRYPPNPPAPPPTLPVFLPNCEQCMAAAYLQAN